MNAIELISQDLFDKVRSRYSNLEMGDEDGNTTSDPRTARFFDFDFILEGEKLGRISISINERGALKIFYSQGILEGTDPVAQKLWFNFLKEMRNFAKRRLLRFDTRDITKSNLDKNDFKYLAQNGSKENNMSESKTYGSSLTSYRPVSKAKIIIRHLSPVDTESRGARTRNIKSIFIENEEGERYKMGVTSIRAAEAMARHVANGGYPHDDCGKKILEMATEIAKLHAFKQQVGKHDSMNSDANSILERACMKLDNLRGQMSSLSKQHHYEAWKASFVPGSMEEYVMDDVTMEDYKSKFTVSTFKEDLTQFFPLIHKIMQETGEVELDEYVSESEEEYCDACDRVIEKCSCDDSDTEVKEFAEFENWASSIVEGAGKLDVAALSDLLNNESFKEVGADATATISALNNIGIEDSELEEQLTQLAKETDGTGDPTDTITTWLQQNDSAAAQELANMQQSSKTEPAAPEAEPAAPEAEPAAGEEVPAEEDDEGKDSYKEAGRPTIASVAEMVSSFYNRHHMEEGLGPFPMGKQGVVTKVTKEMGEWAGELAGRIVDHYSNIGLRNNDQPIKELSNAKLGQYKTAAAAHAGKLDQTGRPEDTAKANKRFGGIVKATKKQFANDVADKPKNPNYDKHGYWDRPENEGMGDDHVGMIKDIISTIHPQGGSREDYQMLVAKQVPDAYSRTPEFAQDFNDAYDEFYHEKMSGNDGEDDFTDYTMRRGEMGNPDRMRESLDDIKRLSGLIKQK
jgi:hypothetical protein